MYQSEMDKRDYFNRQYWNVNIQDLSGIKVPLEINKSQVS